MALNAFTSRLGRGQGRIRNSSGGHIFVLGEDEPGRYFNLASGDFVEVTQSTDLTHVKLVRAPLRLRVPASTPEGFAWEAFLVVDGVKHASMRARPGKQRLVADLAANVSKLAGVHILAIRLELVGT